MEFWYTLYIILWSITCVAIHVSECSRKKLLYVVLFIIWVVGSFRYNIGTDYGTYALWYDTWNNYVGGTYDIGEIEPGFWLIITFLNALNFKSQALFLLAETLIIIFLYKGLSYYVKESQVIFLAILMYATYPVPGGHWWDMNVIRQAVAISISFFGTTYLHKDKLWKFLLYSILAISFHYSAILVLLLCLFKNKRIHIKVIYSILILGFILNGLGITNTLMLIALSKLSVFAGKYIADYTIIGGGALPFSTMAFVLVTMYYLANKQIGNQMPNIIYNAAALYIILRVYTSCGLEGSILAVIIHRFEAYYVFFYLILLASAMWSFVLNQKRQIYGRICIMLFLFIFCTVMGLQPIKNDANNILAKMGGASGGNINYEFNFDFLQ